MRWVRGADAVVRHGIKVLVIDPWNEVEHFRPKNESETQYVNRALRQIRRFTLRNQGVATIVAHPTKDVGKGGEARTPRSTTSRGRPPVIASHTKASSSTFRIQT